MQGSHNNDFPWVTNPKNTCLQLIRQGFTEEVHGVFRFDLWTFEKFRKLFQIGSDLSEKNIIDMKYPWEYMLESGKYMEIP